MDVLSDVLLSVRLTGAVFFAVDAPAPFVTESPSASAVCDQVLPGAERVIPFHVVIEGSCWAESTARPAPPVQLQAGDMVAFPAGDANAIASTPGMRGRPDPSLWVRPPDRALPFPLRVSQESTADRTRFVCGFLGCDTRPFNPLLESLPPVLHARVSGGTHRLVLGLLDAALQPGGEGDAAGREAMMAKLAELMFVEALRSHLAGLPDAERGWLAGIQDPVVGAALRLMHGRPSEQWTLEGLARTVGLSRSAFAERFVTFVHMPPMHYLANWRLQLAASMLKTSAVSVAQASAAVGYQSEAAFNRAFKRAVGQAPGTWRRARPEGETVAAGSPAGR